MVTVIDPYCSVYDIRKSSQPTVMGSHSVALPARCAILDLMLIELNNTKQAVFNEFTGPFTPSGSLARMIAPEP